MQWKYLILAQKNLVLSSQKGGLPRWYSGKEYAWQCRRCRLDLCVMNIPWRREWQPAPVFMTAESQGPEEPGWLHSMVLQRIRYDSQLNNNNNYQNGNSFSSKDLPFFLNRIISHKNTCWIILKQSSVIVSNRQSHFYSGLPELSSCWGLWQVGRRAQGGWLSILPEQLDVLCLWDQECTCWMESRRLPSDVSTGAQRNISASEPELQGAGSGQ